MRSRRTMMGLAAGLLMMAGPALAQSPSADSIINSLRPGAGMTGGTRGIRPVGPSEATPVAPAPVAPAALPRAGYHAAAPVMRAPAAQPPAGAAAVSTQSGTPSVNLTVQFGNNSAELTPAAMKTLDQLGEALSSPALASYRFRIEGHTDNLGNHDHNQVLSEERAKAVVDYLANKFHVDRARVEAVGMGPDQPLVPARANLPEPRNRRVTVVNLGT